MKKTMFLSALLCSSLLGISNNSYGQWTPVTGVGNAIETDPGLFIDDIRFSQTSSQQDPIRSIRGETSTGYFEIYGNHQGSNGPGLFMYSNNVNTASYPWATPGKISIWSSFGSSDYNTETAFELIHNEPDPQQNQIIQQTNLFSIDKDGDITLKHNSTDGANFNAIRGNSDAAGVVLYANDNWANGAGILLNGKGGLQGGSIQFTVPDLNNIDKAFSFHTANSTTGVWNGELMRIMKDGQVAIGNTATGNPNDYKLYVEKGILVENGNIYADNGEVRGYNVWADNLLKSTGDLQVGGKIIVGDPLPTTPPGYSMYVKDGILTEKIKVALSTDLNNWSDFVFDEDYELRSLNEVEDYIKENKHLPEIPSTEEVHKNGLDLAQMDAKLLQKVEELTLYVIQQQKRIEQLEEKLNK